MGKCKSEMSHNSASIRLCIAFIIRKMIATLCSLEMCTRICSISFPDHSSALCAHSPRCFSSAIFQSLSHVKWICTVK